ncbi:MAG TPA: hypothetical protein DDW73_05715 [Rhizobium sp.]|nr:hypothetical protein [Rhizobium sp.]
MAEVLRDPMIRQMLRADGVSLSDFAVLLDDAAKRRNLPRHKSAVVIPAPHVISHSNAQMVCCQSL